MKPGRGTDEKEIKTFYFQSPRNFREPLVRQMTYTPTENDIQEAEERFFSKVQIAPNGCLEWIASRTAQGYGHFWFYGRLYKAHRWIFGIKHGKWPEQVCHSCDNPPCVNLDHLYGGTNLENQRDSIKKGRHVGALNLPSAHAAMLAKTHCPNGHEYTIENTGMKTTGTRRCRTCSMLSTRRLRAIK